MELTAAENFMASAGDLKGKGVDARREGLKGECSARIREGLRAARQPVLPPQDDQRSHYRTCLIIQDTAMDPCARQSILRQLDDQLLSPGPDELHDPRGKRIPVRQCNPTRVGTLVRVLHPRTVHGHYMAAIFEILKAAAPRFIRDLLSHQFQNLP